MLASAFAPKTFALTIECCGIADITGALPLRREWIHKGHAAEIRSPALWVERIGNKVFVFHGTADDVVHVDHGRAFEKALRDHGKEFEVYYTEGGRHFLEPVTSRNAQTIAHCTDDIMTRRLDGHDDFERQSEYRFGCADGAYVVSFKGGWMTIQQQAEG
jgi:hypothetical protein